MKNIIKERPTDTLHGRKLFSTQFVSDDDIREKTILNIGCGYGWFELNAVFKGASLIIGTEIGEKDLNTAKIFARHNNISYQVSNAIALPFANETFHTVISWEVIEHIPRGSELQMFSEVSRVLKKGGIFYMSTPYAHILSNFFDPAWWLIGHRHYSREKLVRIATQAGFSIEQEVKKGGFWEIFGINNLYISKWIFRRKPFFEQEINVFQDREYGKPGGISNIFLKLRKKT
jgi:SAM-dependent methyltransferase